MDLAVVVATRNRRGSLLRTLERLSALPERPEVIVVDNGSTDGTRQAVGDRFPGVELVALVENHGAAARTAGVERARAPYVAFADDDSWWAPGALARAVEILDAHPRVGLVAARILVGAEERLDPTCREMAASPLPSDDLPGPSVLGFVACGTVVRREAYLAAGGFDARLRVGGEERDLAIELARRRWRLVYAEHVVAHHHPSPVRDIGARRLVEARNELWTAWLHRSLGGVLRVTARGVRHPAALASALRGLPWVLRERRPVGPALEAQLQAIDRRSVLGEMSSGR